MDISFLVICSFIEMEMEVVVLVLVFGEVVVGVLYKQH